MANYETLKAAIADVIKTNGNNAITGELLQQSLLAMVNSLGTGYQFKGKATEDGTPGTPDQNVLYVAAPGTYPNYGNVTIPEQNIGFITYNGSWAVSTIETSPFSAQNIIDDIIQLYDGSTPVYPRTRAEAVFFDGDTNKTLGNKLIDVGLHQFLHAENVTSGTYYPFPYFNGVSNFRIRNIGSVPIRIFLRVAQSSGGQQDIGRIEPGEYKTIAPSAEFKYIFYYLSEATSGGSFSVSPISSDEIEVENQVKTNAEELDEIKETIFVDDLVKLNYDELIASSYIDSSGNIVSAGASSFSVASFPVSDEMKLKITNTFHSGISYSYAFYNSDNFSSETLVELGPAVVSSEDVMLVDVPEGATYLAVQYFGSTTQIVDKIIGQTPVNQIVAELEKNMEELQVIDFMQLAYQKDDNNLFVAYNAGNGIEYTYWFRKCMANNLFTFYKVGYRPVTRNNPDASNISTDKTIVVINQTSSDNIGPLKMVNGEYTWVGGNHTYGENVKTAKTDSVSVFVDGRLLGGNASGFCNKLCVRVQNTIFDPAIAPGEGATILPTPLCTESVTYIVNKNTIEVGVSQKFVSTTQNGISRYYGMQSMFRGEDYVITPNGEFVDWTATANLDDFLKEDYPHFNRFVEKKTSAPAYQSTFLFNDFGLGRHNDLSNISPIYRRGDTGKDYHQIISNMDLLANKYIEWAGAYSFFKDAVVDNNDVLVYRGVVRGKDALFINTKRAFDGTVNIPTDLLFREHTLFECYGIVDGDGGTDFHTGGDGLYIKSTSTGSVIILFN